MEKRTNKSKEELTADLKEKKREQFLKEYEELTQPLFDKYLMRIIPRVVNLSNEYKMHIEAAFAVQEFKKENVEVTPKKADEKLETKPETNGSADTDNQASKG